MIKNLPSTLLLSKGLKTFISLRNILLLFIGLSFSFNTYAQNQVQIIGPDSVCLSQVNTLQLIANVANWPGTYNYSWFTSNGQTGNGPTFTISSNTPTRIIVSLVIFDSAFSNIVGGDSMSVLFQACNNNLPGWAMLNQIACIGLPSAFYAVNGNLVDTSTIALWNMGDGTQYQLPPYAAVTHSYTSPGTYTIQHCLVDPFLMDTACASDTVTVVTRCWPAVQADSIFVFPDSICPGQTVSTQASFTGGPLRGVGIISYVDWGDGTVTPGQGGGHSYSQPGDYLVQYCAVDTVYGDTSCSGSMVHVLSTCTDTISGYLYVDSNQNGSFDTGESPIVGQAVNITGGSMAFSDFQGYYAIALSPGTYTVNAPTIPLYQLSSPQSGNYTFTLTGNNNSQRGDFGYDTLQPALDVAVRLAMSPPPRPGFIHCVSAYYSNNGTVSTSGTVTIQYDAKAVFQSAYPQTGSTHDPVNRTVSWTYSNLQPNQGSERVFACFRLPATTALGDQLVSNASITPAQGDINPTDNFATLTSTVVGSYDPNDKAVDQPAIIQGDEWLGYKIRFQNTGTDTAFNIVVRDTLDLDLDLSTFEMLSASHGYQLNINEDREAVWSFANILLPDSGANQELSNGEILYRVKPNQALVPGTLVENTAAIYFDFNAPIITNTTVNAIAGPLFFEENNDDESKTDIPGLAVYPNPAKDFLSMRFYNPDGLLHKASLSTSNGKTICQESTYGEATFITLKDLPSGLYLLHISNEAGLYSWKKIMVE